MKKKKRAVPRQPLGLEAALLSSDDGGRAVYREHCGRLMERVHELPPAYRACDRAVVDRLERLAGFYLAHFDSLSGQQLLAMFVLLEPQVWALEQATGVVVPSHDFRHLEIVE